ncbi:hypothetical protein [Alkalihalobacillus sp. LMS39]|uniref:hypothetical protein n=1 Tax=Alkalihalobacillus sp. LMS39 TaxID=2924032 RepID=UPI001FB1AE14|nr:hypothetical protein [Alkalihalobacillus sp. LMS39]UOE92488.1 hypothetical protein MM271_14700 [Alkalihalobacillus sp. LMS39]
MMKRYWLVTEGGQCAVYDSEEKTITEWVDVERNTNPTELIFQLRNKLERHDEEIGDIEDENGNPVIEVLGYSD